MNANEFVALMSKLQQPNKSFKLGTIDSAFDGVGAPKVVFDGETTASLKGYTFLDSYSPKANDRVIMADVAGTCVILGDITSTGNNENKVDITPPSGWANYGGGYETLGYTKKNGFLTIHGMLNPPVTSGTTTLFTLPVGYRPAAHIIVPAFGYDGTFKTVQCNINSSGGVTISTLGTDFSWISIGANTFPVG